MAKKKPKRPAKQNRGRVIGFRANETEYETFHLLASAAGLTISEWTRLQLRRAANLATG